MSRIYDALRRVEQLKGGAGVEVATDAPLPSLEEVLKPLTSDMNSLKMVPRVSYVPQPETHLLGSGDTDRAGLERFKLLRYRLHQVRQQRILKSVLVTSAVPKEGKSTVAANLAVTLAQTSERVLLIDADMRKPSLHSILGLSPSEGLSDFLQGRVELAGAMRQVDPLGVYFVPAGRSPGNPVELLQSELMSSAMNTLKADFEWVVIDSPPLLPLADGRFLASLCDAAIVVTREGHTRQEDLRECLASLEGTHLAGIVLNGSTTAVRSEYSYYYPSMSASEAKNRTSRLIQRSARTQA